MIRAKVLEQIKSNVDCHAELSKAHGVSVRTVERWIFNNSKKLALPTSLEIIGRYTTESEITKGKAVKA